MMPLFGNPVRFAIEYERDEEYPGGLWMWGKVCLWCGGQRIGDYGTVTSLRDVLFQLDERAKDNGRRQSARFMSMKAVDVFRTLDGALYWPGNDEELAIEEQWARHRFHLGIDVLSGWKGYVVENDKLARLILSRDPYSEVQEVQLSPGELDAVIDAARHALNEIYEHEVEAETKR